MNWTEAYLLADMEAEDMMRAEETADRIKQLVAANEAQAAEIERLAKACAEWAEVSQSNYQRAKVAEAKLAKAVEALGCWNRMMNNPAYDMGEMVSEFDAIARATLAELTGGKDD